jgi:hypothetical protein
MARKSRAKWKRGEEIRSISALMDYRDAMLLRGMRLQNIMVYGPRSRECMFDIRKNRRGVRPTSLVVLLNMPFAFIERLCRYGSLWRAERRDS